MKNYYYVHTGHRIGLDRFRRAASIVRELQKKDVDITLLCSDFRIAGDARHHGIDKAVGLDVVRNIPYIANYGDNLIFDSDEANPIMLEDMKEFFTNFIQMHVDEVVVDEKYFKTYKKTIPLSFFFGDDDYEKDLEHLIPTLKELDLSLLMGYYYFFDFEDTLEEIFPSTYPAEDYDEVITSSKVLISSSPQAVLESLASGGKPIYLKREDYGNSFDNVINKFNIPIVKSLDLGQIKELLSTISNHRYHTISKNPLNFLSFMVP